MNEPRLTGVALRPGSRLFKALSEQVRGSDMLFIVGLPGVGKSLMLQQTALLAEANGRRVSLLRWDVARIAFEEAPAAERFPEIGSVTHAAIRLAVGYWLRPAVSAWHSSRNSSDLLIAECPFVGNRCIELARRQNDSLETALAGDSTRFLVPVPTLDVRARIESVREEELKRPRHAQEVYNAPSDLLDKFVGELHELADRLEMTSDAERRGYVPESYLAVYQHLLRFRNCIPLIVDEFLPTLESAQALPASCNELVPSEFEVEACLEAVGQLTEQAMQRRVADWWQV